MNTDTTHPMDIPERRRLQRSRSDRKLAGVSGGLAAYFEIHPAIFRVGFVILTLLGCAGIPIYAAAALVIPDEGKQDSIATAALRNRRDRPWPLIGLAFLAVAGIALVSRLTLWPRGDSWFLFLIAGAVILWITRHPKADPTLDVAGLAAEDSRRVRRLARRLVLAVAVLVALVSVAAAIVVSAFDVRIGDGVGERTHRVALVDDLRGDYRLGIGTLLLDLRNIQLPPGETHVNARVDIGELRVIVPVGAGLRVHGSAQLGEIMLPNSVNADGHNVTADMAVAGASALVIDADVGLGSVKVERALP